MRDNHLHSYFSYDSDGQITDYLDHYDGQIITTEHFDLSNPYGGELRDEVPDYQAYSLEIERLKQVYGNRLKRGIEIGYYAPREADILAYLADKDYDLKLLSVHHNGQFDYLEDAVLDLDKDQLIPQYLADLEKAIERVPAHVLAHFDYAFRRLDLTPADLAKFRPQLVELFQKMIDYGLAFELNCKSIYLYQNEALYRYALQLVCDLGCQKFSVGSDGHKLEHFRLNFDKIEELLAEFGIDQSLLI
ncbi:PHP domain-containing protein [Streptococcus oricebi]|uniref:Histidinol-phosphatase n=1 Tax=Streptococcus oricebi TaxID=1547447 RepID=A0ABS5B170_9STRE|nr:PHP domain-containing protein [Streptococcus oricebi]MBP2622573.1 hypothetical protein [Streptococcus oricebi]